MLPKNSKHFIQPTATKLNQPVELVDDVVSFFFSAVRKSLTEMQGDNIKVVNLGSFKVKPKELPKLIAKHQKHLEVLQPETFNQMKLQKLIEIKLDRVKKLQAFINEEKARRKQFMLIKNERKIKSNME